MSRSEYETVARDWQGSVSKPGVEAELSRFLQNAVGSYLARTGISRDELARTLGMSRTTLWRKLKEPATFDLGLAFELISEIGEEPNELIAVINQAFNGSNTSPNVALDERTLEEQGWNVVGVVDANRPGAMHLPHTLRVQLHELLLELVRADASDEDIAWARSVLTLKQNYPPGVSGSDEPLIAESFAALCASVRTMFAAQSASRTSSSRENRPRASDQTPTVRPPRSAKAAPPSSSREVSAQNASAAAREALRQRDAEGSEEVRPSLVSKGRRKAG